MKKFYGFFVLCVVMILSATCLFAEETSVSADNLKTAFEQKLSVYYEKYEECSAAIRTAYENKDGNAYAEAVKEIRNLEYPVLSKEDSDVILSEAVKNEDFDTASWLFQNSRYYCPVLKFSYSSDNYSFEQKISVKPGSDVKLSVPALRDKTLVFSGWGLTKDEVSYKGGETIKMPLTDTILYAIFTANPNLVQGASVSIKNLGLKYYDNLELISGKQMVFNFTVENNGSETLKGLEVSFESDDPLFVILTDTLKCNSLSSLNSVVAGFTVITKAASGTVLEGVITVKNSEGQTWSENVSFTVK